MGADWDPRHGPGWPNCDQNHNRVDVRLDFGLGKVFDTVYTTGGVAPLLNAIAAIKAINDDPTKPSYRVDVAGTYACRPMRTHPQPSLHSVPVAIDINPSHNSMGGGRGDIPQWFADCFIRQGFTWGIEWNDAMHFENGAWYGKWDGTYPEVDDLALTPDEKQALAFLHDSMDEFKGLFDILQGMTASMQKAPSAPNNRPLTKAGYRFSNDMKLFEAGGHGS